jgi:dipeptidase E
MRLLLLSNSTMKGTPYMAWPQPYLIEFFKDIDELLFIPYAGVTVDYDEYSQSLTEALKPTNTRVVPIHNITDKQEAIAQARCLAVGGGNTFRLLYSLQQEQLLEPIRKAVEKGARYIGWSAGSNVAGPTIKTTNDMPIIEPHSFNALNLIDFQINAHYTTKTIPGHGGESRNLRLKELLIINPAMKVVCLPEGKLLELSNGQWFLRGIDGEEALVMTAEHEPVVLKDGPIKI